MAYFLCFKSQRCLSIPRIPFHVDRTGCPTQFSKKSCSNEKSTHLALIACPSAIAIGDDGDSEGFQDQNTCSVPLTCNHWTRIPFSAGNAACDIRMADDSATSTGTVDPGTIIEGEQNAHPDIENLGLLVNSAPSGSTVRSFSIRPVATKGTYQRSMQFPTSESETGNTS